MPTYEYQCDAGCTEHGLPKRFVRVYAIGKPPARVKCPECGSTKVSRVYSAFYAKTVRKS